MFTRYDKLCLGTVQLGMKYGIRSQRDEKPEANESIRLLQTAYAKGIKYFDTAQAYGDAECLLKQSGIAKEKDVRIITKIGGVSSENIKRTVELSLEKMNVNSTDGILLHEPEDYFDLEVLRALQDVKNSGLTTHIGVSIYDPQDAIRIVKDNIVDYIQIPYNVLDQRLDNTDFFTIAKKNSITIFARSSFLQGLVLFDEEELPSRFDAIRKYLHEFYRIITDYGFSRREAAMLFSLGNPGVSYVVFGVDNEKQLYENIEILDRLDEFEDCRKQLIGLSEGIDDIYLNPSLWGKL